MLGYRTLADLDSMPSNEYNSLAHGTKSRVFDAYVNIGEIDAQYAASLVDTYDSLKFIITVKSDSQLDLFLGGSPREPAVGQSPNRNRIKKLIQITRIVRDSNSELLRLTAGQTRKWREICSFLQTNEPASPYPDLLERGQRTFLDDVEQVGPDYKSERMDWDSLPWIVNPGEMFGGVELQDGMVDLTDSSSLKDPCQSSGQGTLFPDDWNALHETFPDNLAMFSPQSVVKNASTVTLNLDCEKGSVRDYRSGAFGTTDSIHYGRFSAKIKPAQCPGAVTGMFLHRNSPRQEIDVEFVGNRPTKLLCNVFYNPGDAGTRLEYGNRGTPVLIELGFDASKKFHRYTIEWKPNELRWYVDGDLVHRRTTWQPTPIPNLPMQFYLNLWVTRSDQLAGSFEEEQLPIQTQIRDVQVNANDVIQTSRASHGGYRKRM
jgi:hypothetical protein